MPYIEGCFGGKGCWASLKKLASHEACVKCENVRQLHAGDKWCGWTCIHCWLDVVREEGEELCTNGACETFFLEAGLTRDVGNALLALPAPSDVALGRDSPSLQEEVRLLRAEVESLRLEVQSLRTTLGSGVA